MTGQVQLPFRPSWRDLVAHRLASAALLIASPTYRALLRGAYLSGFACAVTDCPNCHPAAKEAS